MSAALDLDKCFALVSLRLRSTETCREQSERNSETSEFIRQSGASTQNKWCIRTPCVARTLLCAFVCYVRYARFLQMLWLASLFACGQSDGVRVAHSMRRATGLHASLGVRKKRKSTKSSCLSFCGAVYAKQMVLSHRCFALDTACPICLLCPLRST